MLKNYLNAPIVYIMIAFVFLSVPLMAQGGLSGQLIKIETSKGVMLIKLYDETPAHRDNMIKLIKEGFTRTSFFTG